MRNSVFINLASQKGMLASGTSSGTRRTRSAAANQNSYKNILLDLQNEVEATKRSGTKIDTAAMSMDEYKEYIADKLNDMPEHTSRKNYLTSIVISDAAWKKMKSDPQFEKNVLEKFQAHFSAEDTSYGEDGCYELIEVRAKGDQALGISSWRRMAGDAVSVGVSSKSAITITQESTQEIGILLRDSSSGSRHSRHQPNPRICAVADRIALTSSMRTLETISRLLPMKNGGSFRLFFGNGTIFMSQKTKSVISFSKETTLSASVSRTNENSQLNNFLMGLNRAITDAKNDTTV